MLLDLWQSVWEVQPLCRQLECWDFIIFLTPCPLALEASPPPGARPRLRQAPYPCLGRPARGAADCQSQSCSVSQLAGRRQRAELPERVIWQPWHSSSHHTRALLVRGLEIITAYPAGWVECFSCTIGLAYFYWILNIQFQSNSKECAQGFRSAWLPPLCSRVWKFIILNNGKITEAFPARTSASKEPSVPTPLGHMLTVAEAVVLIQVPHYSGHDGQANFFHWWKKGEWSGEGEGNRMQKDPGPGGWHMEGCLQRAGWRDKMHKSVASTGQSGRGWPQSPDPRGRKQLFRKSGTTLNLFCNNHPPAP